ncbi:ABC transporter ATP-binding protein [Nakamurella sp.]|uniref:ABC transporter ATP-binding protein n=1 Tax=Nakamurella sp. TaxID=1869182 RepID=UPI003783714C
MSEILLAAMDVHRSFGPTEALRGADLTVEAGEIVSVIGPSGSGKSTLLHCAAGILPVDSGTVTFDGVDLSTLSDRERSRLRLSEFGFVFQFGRLIPELTCRDNVAVPLRLSGRGRRDARAIADEWLGRLAVDDVADRRPGEASGGQAQRVALACALATEPRVIFADEPTGALDSMQGEAVMRLLTTTVRHTGAALVLVTHEPRIAAYADREVLVRDGRTGETRAAA